jgi:MFS family permease
MATAPRPISSLRWWIGGFLFASTVINYIDRRTLYLLAPYLKLEHHWTDSNYANIAIAFRVAYSLGQTVCVKVMERVGTRRGLTLTVIWYSAVPMLTSLASGFYSFATFRSLLGTGESANWPAATKAVSEWSPKREPALATALFDSSSSIAGAVAPFLVLWIYFRWGWRPAFMVPGALGFLWLIVWRWLLSLVAARKAPIIYGGIAMTLLIPIIFSTKLWVIAFLFGVVTFTYAGFTTMANVLPSDLFSSDSVASVSGLSGTGAVIGTIVAFQLIGHYSGARQATGTHSFDPIVILAGPVPLVGMILVLLLVRNTEARNEGLVRRI